MHREHRPNDQERILMTSLTKVRDGILSNCGRNRPSGPDLLNATLGCPSSHRRTRISTCKSRVQHHQHLARRGHEQQKMAPSSGNSQEPGAVKISQTKQPAPWPLWRWVPGSKPRSGPWVAQRCHSKLPLDPLVRTLATEPPSHAGPHGRAPGSRQRPLVGD